MAKAIIRTQAVDNGERYGIVVVNGVNVFDRYYGNFPAAHSDFMKSARRAARFWLERWNWLERYNSTTAL